MATTNITTSSSCLTSFPIINGSTSFFGDIHVDQDVNWSSLNIGKSMVEIWLLLLAESCTTSGLDYLDRKPLGSQSILDIPQRLHLQTIRGTVMIRVLATLIHNHLTDSGHLIASIIMWPFLDLMHASLFLLGFNSLVQLILVLNPGFQLPVRDGLAYWILFMGVLGPLLIMNIICHVKGTYPPIYYVLRGCTDNSGRGFVILATTLFIIIILVYTVVRLFIYFRSPSAERKLSNQLISNKMNIILIPIVWSSLILMLTMGDHVDKLLTTSIMLTIFMGIFIMANPKLLKHYLRSHPCLAKSLKAMKKMCGKESSKVKPSETELSVISA